MIPGAVIEIHVLDECLTTGEWCEHCMLPSAVKLPFIGVCPFTMRTLMRCATVVCQDCGAHWNEDMGGDA